MRILGKWGNGSGTPSARSSEGSGTPSARDGIHNNIAGIGQSASEGHNTPYSRGSRSLDRTDKFLSPFSNSAGLGVGVSRPVGGWIEVPAPELRTGRVHDVSRIAHCNSKAIVLVVEQDRAGPGETGFFFKKWKHVFLQKPVPYFSCPAV